MKTTKHYVMTTQHNKVMMTSKHYMMTTQHNRMTLQHNVMTIPPSKEHFYNLMKKKVPHNRVVIALRREVISHPGGNGEKQINKVLNQGTTLHIEVLPGGDGKKMTHQAAITLPQGVQKETRVMMTT